MNMSSPSHHQDSRDVMDDRMDQEQQHQPGSQPPIDHHVHHAPNNTVNAGHGYAGRPNYRYETTPDGDIVVTDPSFDENASNGEAAAETTTVEHSKQQSGNTTNNNWQSSARASSMKRRGDRRHSRNLSAHFFDATKLTDEDDDDNDAQVEKTLAKVKPSHHQGAGVPISSVDAPGQKHRRMFSGDVSNPPLAHRRINSIGKTAAVDRILQRPRSRHRREDSAGLDILSAAVDASNDELADAAGARTTPVWEPPPPVGGSGHHNRLSSLDFFDYGAALPPPRPPGHPGGPMQPPASRIFAHPQHGAPAPAYGSIHPGPISYHHTPYPPSSFYPPPPPGHPHARTSFPVQYSHRPPPPPTDIYKTQQQVYQPPPPPLPGTEDPPGRQPSPTAPFGDDKIESDERLFSNKNGTEAWNSTDPLMPNATASSSMNAHHRKLSSFSSLGAFIGTSIFSPGGGENAEHPLKSHHRATSSSISFLQGLDVLEGSDVMFLRNLHASTPNYGGPTTTNSGSTTTTQQTPPSSSMPSAGENKAHHSGSTANGYQSSTCSNNSGNTSDHSDSGTKLAPGGTSKRVRRKCTVANCPNRVVQGGLCISHGAKRKTCKHPGCTKNVKKAGLCSTHGPARKRCDADGCSKVAVQGGRCIAHGAKKKMCSVDNCKKQAILSGMCKKHHDKVGGVDPTSPPMCVVIGGGDLENGRPAHKTGHTRGLSIFQDLSADAVSNLLSDDDPLNL